MLHWNCINARDKFLCYVTVTAVNPNDSDDMIRVQFYEVIFHAKVYLNKPQPPKSHALLGIEKHHLHDCCAVSDNCIDIIAGLQLNWTRIIFINET